MHVCQQLPSISVTLICEQTLVVALPAPFKNKCKHQIHFDSVVCLSVTPSTMACHLTPPSSLPVPAPWSARRLWRPADHCTCHHVGNCWGCCLDRASWRNSGESLIGSPACPTPTRSFALCCWLSRQTIWLILQKVCCSPAGRRPMRGSAGSPTRAAARSAGSVTRTATSPVSPTPPSPPSPSCRCSSSASSTRWMRRAPPAPVAGRRSGWRSATRCMPVSLKPPI